MLRVWFLFFLMLWIPLRASPQSVDSSNISGIYIKAFNQVRRDEVFLDLTPGHDSISVSKLDNPGITIALGTGTNRFSIAGTAAVMSGEIVPLSLRRAGNQFTIKLKKTGSACDNFLLFLKDDGINQLFPFTSDSLEIPFSQTGDEENRFSLILQPLISRGRIQESALFRLSDALKMGEPFMIVDCSGRAVPTPAFSGSNLSALSPGLYRLIFLNSRKSITILMR